MERREVHKRTDGTGENQRLTLTSHHRVRRMRWEMIAYFTLGSALVFVTLLQTFAPQLQQVLQAKQPAYVSQSYQQITGPQSLPSVQPTHSPDLLHEFARDTFLRADQVTWGVASDQQVWQGDADNAALFAIRGGTGEIGGGQGKVTALLGPVTVNADVLFSGSINAFRGGSANLGAVLRSNGQNKWDKAYIDGTNLVILQRVGEENLTLASIPFEAQASVSYSVRFRADGTLLEAKAWASDSSEPGAWMVRANDVWLQSGWNGIRVVLQPDTRVRVTQFLLQPIGG